MLLASLLFTLPFSVFAHVVERGRFPPAPGRVSSRAFLRGGKDVRARRRRTCKARVGRVLALPLRAESYLGSNL